MHSDPMLLHDSVGTRQHVRWNRQADLFRCFEIDDDFNFVACCTGRSAGLAPFRILST